MSPSCSRQQWKICLGVHIHAFPRELFIEDVRRLSEDYTGEARSWNFSANTWAEDLCAHLCTHQRRTTLLPGWLALHKQTINSPSGLLKFREYLNVCNIYCADLQIWKWSVRQNTHTQKKKKALEQLKSSGSCCRGQFMCTLDLKNDLANLKNNPEWSNQVKESKHAEPHRSRPSEHSVKNTMQMVARAVAMTL